MMAHLVGTLGQEEGFVSLPSHDKKFYCLLFHILLLTVIRNQISTRLSWTLIPQHLLRLTEVIQLREINPNHRLPIISPSVSILSLVVLHLNFLHLRQLVQQLLRVYLLHQIPGLLEHLQGDVH